MQHSSFRFRFSIKHLLIVMTAIAMLYSLPEVVGLIFLVSSIFVFLLSMTLMIAPLLARLKTRSRDSETANEMILQLSVIAACSVGVFLIVGVAELFRLLIG